MTEEEQAILMLKGLIASLSEEQQKNAKDCIGIIRKAICDYPNGEAYLAVVLVYSELQQIISSDPTASIEKLKLK